MKVRLTESKLRHIVRESLHTVLKEEFKVPMRILRRLDGPQDILDGYYDGDIMDYWDDFYSALPTRDAQAAAKERKEYLDFIGNKNLSNDWRDYIKNSDFYDRMWDTDTVKESRYDSPSEWNDETEMINSFTNLINSDKYKIPRGVKEILAKLLNAKSRDEIDELVNEFHFNNNFKGYRDLLWDVAARQYVKVDPEYALQVLERPSEKFNSEEYQGPTVDFYDSDEAADEMWGDGNRRIRRFDKFVHRKGLNNREFERGVIDNIKKHEYGGRDPKKEKLHTRGSANRDLMAIDRQRKNANN